MQGNVVVGNYVETNAAGTAVIDSLRTRHRDPGRLRQRIGGPGPGEGNLIWATTRAFGSPTASPSGNTVVRGNLIGTAADGTVPLGNQTGVDVAFTNETNTIGGTSPEAANTIAFSLRDGVLVYPGATGASILGNSTHSNSEQGIDLVARDSLFLATASPPTTG